MNDIFYFKCSKLRAVITNRQCNCNKEKAATLGRKVSALNKVSDLYAVCKDCKEELIPIDINKYLAETSSSYKKPYKL